MASGQRVITHETAAAPPPDVEFIRRTLTQASLASLLPSAPEPHYEADIHRQPEFPDANGETPVNPAAMQTRKPDNATRSALGK